jgi:hypothetical protein
MNKTPEEILASHLGWDKYSEGPVMCNSTEIISAMKELASQSSTGAGVWVKASEKLPDLSKRVIMQSVINSGGHIVKKQIFPEDIAVIDNKVRLKNGSFLLFGELEWLDEHPAMALNKEYRKALQEIKDLQEEWTSTPISPISMCTKVYAIATKALNQK